MVRVRQATCQPMMPRCMACSGQLSACAVCGGVMGKGNVVLDRGRFFIFGLILHGMCVDGLVGDDTKSRKWFHIGTR